MALRDQIKTYVDATKSPVLSVPTPELPEFDGQIFVSRVSPRSLETYWKDSEEEEELADDRARFAALVACDADGSRIFQSEDVQWLSNSPLLMPMVERLYWAGREHNGLTEENRRAWRKNLPATADVGSPS